VNLSKKDADILAGVIDSAVDGNWPSFVRTVTERGYEPGEICKIVNAVADEAGVDSLFDPGDFEDY
jgi:hypothetical protein